MKKYIFSFWDDPNPPEIVKLCMETWKKWNQDYKVVLLDKNTINKWIKIPKLRFLENSSKQHLADVIRILLIEKYGGFWVDSSILAYCSFDLLFGNTNTLKNYDLLAYHIPNFQTDKRYPIIENWFFGAPLKSPFIKAWKEAFFALDRYPNSIDYYKDIQSKGVNLQNIIYLDYLSMHVAAQWVLQKSPIKYKLLLLDCVQGPFSYLQDGGWDAKKAIALLIKDRRYKKTLVKMRGCERDYVTQNIDIKRLL